MSSLTSFAIRTIISAVTLIAIAGSSGGQIEVSDPFSALIAAVVLGVANAVVKPILQLVAQSATCVLSCLTLGLWSLVLSWLINGFLFWACAVALAGFDVKGFWPALWGSLILSCVSALATVLTRGKEKEGE